MSPPRRRVGDLPRDFPGLLSLWRHRHPERWSKRPWLYAKVGKRILEHGEPLLAYDLFQEGLQSVPKDPELLRLLALSLARSGAADRACEILTDLYRQGRRDEETLGILARTRKDMAASAASPTERAAQARPQLLSAVLPVAEGLLRRDQRCNHGLHVGTA